jgi:hypothetical protein
MKRALGGMIWEVSQEQVYLGNIISLDGKQTTNVEAKKKKKG